MAATTKKSRTETTKSQASFQTAQRAKPKSPVKRFRIVGERREQYEATGISI